MVFIGLAWSCNVKGLSFSMLCALVLSLSPALASAQSADLDVGELQVSYPNA